MQGTGYEHTLVLDSGCSGHMTGRKSLHAEFKRRVGSIISFEDGKKGGTLEYDSIKFVNVKKENGALADELKHTLLNICQLSDKGLHANIDNTKCTITNISNGGTVQIGQKHGNIKEASLRNGPQGKVGCLNNKTSTEESWILEKVVSYLNLKNISLQINQRETATTEGKRFLESEECLSSSKSERNH